MQPYRGIDLLDIESQLTDDERQVRDTIRAFVETEAMPAVVPHFRDGTFPLALIPRMGELGIFGAHIEGYGCAGLGSVAYGLIMQELERADSGYRSFASVQSSLAMTAIHLFGTEEHRERYLPEMASGRVIGAFGLTEADHGSDPNGMETEAVKVEGGYVVNGSKMWITNAGIADVIVVWAKLDGAVRGFLVDAGLPGVTREDIHNKLSMRMSVTSALYFNEVLVGDDALLPGTRGLGSALECLNAARYSIVWGVLWGRGRLPAHRHRIHEGAGAVRTTACLLPTGAGEAGGYGHGALQGATACAAAWTAEGSGQVALVAREHGEVQQHAGCVGDRAHRPRPARGCRGNG